MPESTPDKSVVPALRRRATAQVRHAAQAEPFGDLSQPLPTGREEAALQAALAQLLQPHLPGFGRGTQPLEDRSHFTRNRRLALAEEPPGVIDQQEELPSGTETGTETGTQLVSWPKTFPVQCDDHLLSLLRSVERNPLSAGLVERAELWRWSSLWSRAHGDNAVKALLSPWPVERPANWTIRVNFPLTAKE